MTELNHTSGGEPFGHEALAGSMGNIMQESTPNQVEIFKALFDYAAEGILVLDKSGIIYMVNSSCCEVFGYTGTELIGKPLTMLLPNRYRGHHGGFVDSYFAEPKTRPMGKCLDLTGLHKDGTEVSVEISLSYVKLDEREFSLAFIVETSYRKKMEQDLIENRNKLDAIINKAVDGILTIDARGNIESLNPAAARLFGYDPEEVIGHNVKMLMPEPDHSQHDGYIKRYNETGEARITGTGREVKGKRKDGSLFPFNLSVSEIQLEDRRIFTGIVHDLTQVKEAEKQLKQYSQELEQRVKARTEALGLAIEKLEESQRDLQASLKKERELNELKSRFVSMASHEFRTPLSTILSSTSLVEKYLNPAHAEKRAKHIRRIKSSVRNLTGILNDFLSVDKLEAGKIDSNPQQFDPIELVEDVVEEMHPGLKTGQAIEYSHSGEKKPIFRDPQLLKNVLINLLSNAIKYSPEGKQIFVRTHIAGPNMQIEIEDQGIGIPEEEQNHMFERFFRAHNATNIQGTGLGLNIVKRYLDLLDGSLDFKSKENEGTTFRISFLAIDQPQL